MIELRDELMFAKGRRRYCFVHPADQNKCVKILRARGNPSHRRRTAGCYKRVRPLSMFDDNLRELESFRVLGRHDDSVWNHFPRCYGIQPTSRGNGMVTDLIRDEGGGIPRTVRQYVVAHGKTRELCRALDIFFDLLLSQRIITRDILDHNLVVQIRAEGLRVFMIDGFGSSEAIPIARWVPVMGRRKIFRKIARFRSRYGF